MMEPEEIVRKYSQMVYNLALRLLGNPRDAEDLAQDALLRALKALPSFRGESEPGTWIYRITVNLWKNRVRSEKRRGLWKMFSLNHGDDEMEEKILQIPDGEPLPEKQIEQAGERRAVESALAELAPEDRAILLLREMDECSYSDIARILQVPEGTVKSRLSRAREALREKLEAYRGVI